MERPVPTSATSKKLPSLDEAERVVSYVLTDRVKDIAVRAAAGKPAAETVRELLALTIAVVTLTEWSYRSVGRQHPERWEFLERSARTFTNEFVVKWLATNDQALKRAVANQRRRKLAARSGSLQLVESQRDKRARWVTVTLRGDAPVPISDEVADGLNERTMQMESRLVERFARVELTDPLAIAGQVLRPTCFAECRALT